MLEKTDIEAVYVATPILCHADHCCQALNSGKHVLSEVTALADMRDCDLLLNRVKRTGLKYMLAENFCYLRTWMILMEMVKAGLFGEIYYAVGDYLMDFTARAGYPHIGGWRQNVYHMHRGHVYITHSLGSLMMLFEGESVKKLCCVGSGQHSRSWGLRADNTCSLLLQTKSEKLIRLRQDFLSSSPENYLFYAIQGTDGVYEGGRSYPGAYHEGDRRAVQDCSHKVSTKRLCKSSEWIDLCSLKEYHPDDAEGWLHDSDVQRYGVYNEGVGVMFNEFAEVIDGARENELTLERSLNWAATGLLSEGSADNRGMAESVPDYAEDK